MSECLSCLFCLLAKGAGCWVLSVLQHPLLAGDGAVRSIANTKVLGFQPFVFTYILNQHYVFHIKYGKLIT